MLAQDKPSNYRAALQGAVHYLKECGVPEPRLDAEILLAFTLKVERFVLHVEPLQELTWDEWQRFKGLLERRAAREPLQYLVGRQEFMSLEFEVNPSVLIPRPDTEVLVEAALDWAASQSAPLRLLDICTGSGAIAVSLAHFLPSAEVYAGDISPAALEVAKRNALKHKVKVQFAQGDLVTPFQGQTYNLVTANPPYIPSVVIPTLQPEVATQEPMLALDGGLDGLDFYRRLALELPGLLQTGSQVLVEIGWDQGVEVDSLFRLAGFSEVKLIKDYGGRDRVLSAAWTHSLGQQG